MLHVFDSSLTLWTGKQTGVHSLEKTSVIRRYLKYWILAETPGSDDSFCVSKIILNGSVTWQL